MEKSELVIEKEMFLEQIKSMHQLLYKEYIHNRTIEQKELIDILEKDLERIIELEQILER